MSWDFSTLPLTKIPSRYPDRKIPLHALTVLSGHCREASEDYVNDGTSRNVTYYSVWQYTIAGRGRLDKKNKSIDVLPGMLMLLTVPGEETYYLPKNSNYWEFVFLSMVGRESYRAVKTVESRRGSLVPADSVPQTMEYFHDFIHKLFHKEISSPLVNSSMSYNLCMSLLEEAGATGERKDVNSFEELLVLLHDNYSQDISVEEMARIMRLSRSHFTRLFSRNMGMGPREYLEDLRLKTAASLLQNETITIKEVAGRVGIQDENYFCRLFKNRYGLSPGKFQNRNYWQR
jgi:AraC-like DNA-binding protein